MPGKRPVSLQNGLTLALVVLAAGVLEAARSEWVLAVTPHVISLIATSLLTWLAARDLQRPGQTESVQQRRAHWFFAGAILLAVAQELLFRRLGWGQDLNFALLNVMRNVMFVLAALAVWPRLTRLAVAMSLFLVLGAVALATTAGAQLLGLLYGMLGVWWLLGNHWEQLRGHFPSESRREVPRTIAGALVGATAICVLVVASALSSSRLTTSLAGFLPSSGGDHGYDEYASRGVNDGDDLVAAEQDADSFGAIESQVFLDSEMPSLYDMFNDMYGEEVKKPKLSERTVALDNPNPTVSHRHLNNTEKSGREFSAVRRRHQRRQQALEKRSAAALLYVQGRVPLHLGLESYDLFDGTSWSQAPPSQAETSMIRVRDARGILWIRPDRSGNSPALAEVETHLVKLMRLKTNRIPSPMHLAGVKIDKIDRAEFFAQTPDGMLSMPGRTRVPSLTVAHLQSRPIHVEQIAERSFPAISAEHSESLLQLPNTSSREKLGLLASRWTAGTPRGWPQIARVCERLREDFQLDTSAAGDERSDDPVGDFLFQTHRGPDYLFASSAALMLRSLGYPSRVVSGLYANPDRYDRRSRRTEVLPEDVHFWVEVYVDGSTWATVEATPGYEVLGPPVPWWQQAWRGATAFAGWLARNPLPLTAFGLALVLIYHLRRQVADALATFRWRLALWRSPDRLVCETLRLLERRTVLAGLARAPTTPLQRHYLPVMSRATHRERLLLEQTLELAGRVLYSPSPGLCSAAARQVCCDVVRCWSMQRIGELARPSEQRVSICERPPILGAT